MLARILNIEKVEANSTEHSYVCETRRGGGDCLLVEFDLLTQKMKKTPALSSIQCKSQKNGSLILKGLCPNMLLDLNNHRYLVDDLVIDQWEVVRKLRNTANLFLTDPHLLPYFDYEQFPFVVARV